MDIFASQGSAIAQEAIARIVLLYALEDKARGLAPADRVVLSPLAGAIRYALGRMKKVRPYLDNGFLEIDNNTAERAVKPVALGRKNWTFAGSEGGGKAMAIAYTLIETAKLNQVDPQAWAHLGPRSHRGS